MLDKIKYVVEVVGGLLRAYTAAVVVVWGLMWLLWLMIRGLGFLPWPSWSSFS